MIERVIRLEEKIMSVDTRLALTEQDLRALHKKIDTHFYWMLAAFGGLYASMAGLLAKGDVKVDSWHNFLVYWYLGTERT
jgi:hypothetical protein